MRMNLTNKQEGHQRRNRIISNTITYVILVIISIIWIFPFVYLILQSFRGESTGVVGYLIPEEWTFDNSHYLILTILILSLSGILQL